MRFPIFKWSGMTTANPGSVSSYNHILPVCQPGNMLVLFVQTRGVGITINTPSGWTIVKSDPNNAVFYKVATASDSGANVSLSPVTAPQYMLSAAVEVHGVNGAPVGSTVVTASDTAPNAGSVTVSAIGCPYYRFITFQRVSQANITQTTPPSGYTERLDLQGSGVGSGCSFAINEKDVPSLSATEDPGTSTLSAAPSQYGVYTVGFAGLPNPDVLMWSAP